jgi:hypothetical protein
MAYSDLPRGLLLGRYEVRSGPSATEFVRFRPQALQRVREFREENSKRITGTRALSGCPAELMLSSKADRTLAYAASVMSFQQRNASVRAARYEWAEIR